MDLSDWSVFESRVEPEPMSGCHLWTGSVTSAGYGNVNVGGGRNQLAHRLSYQHHVGPIPAGYEVDHRCRVRSCVNPAHLEAVTGTVNRWRQVGVGTDGRFCKHGHSNWSPRRTGGRRCVDCQKERHARATA